MALRLNLIGRVVLVGLVLSLEWDSNAAGDLNPEPLDSPFGVESGPGWVSNPGPLLLAFELETMLGGGSAEKAGKCVYALLSAM